MGNEVTEINTPGFLFCLQKQVKVNWLALNIRPFTFRFAPFVVDLLSTREETEKSLLEMELQIKKLKPET